MHKTNKSPLVYPFGWSELNNYLGKADSKRIKYGCNLTVCREYNRIDIRSYRTTIVQVRQDNSIRIAAYGISYTTTRHANLLGLGSAVNIYIGNWRVSYGTPDYPAFIKDGQHQISEDIKESLKKIQNQVLVYLFSEYPDIHSFSLILYGSANPSLSVLRSSDSSIEQAVYPFSTKKGKQFREQIKQQIKLLPFCTATLSQDLNAKPPIEKLFLLSQIELQPT